MKKLLSLFAGIALLASAAFAQTALLNTTTTAAIDAKTQIVPLTAVTNLTAWGNPISLSAIGTPSGTALWVVYIDREAMSVVSLDSLKLTVRRGQHGTKANAHVSGAKVLAGPVSAFWVSDPSGTCTRTQLPYVPVINVANGKVWDCGGGKWGNFTDTPQVGASIAGQSGVMTGAYAIIAAVTHITSAAPCAITGFAIPAGLPDGGSFTVIPDYACTWTAATNIVKTGTMVVGQALTFTYDKSAAKPLSPSY